MNNCGKQKLIDSETKYYSQTEHLIFEIIVLCKCGVIFKQCVPKKQSGFGKKFTGCVILRDIGVLAM